jgi:hypothetical protein
VFGLDLLARYAGFAAAVSVDLPKSRGVWARFARFIVLRGGNLVFEQFTTSISAYGRR